MSQEWQLTLYWRPTQVFDAHTTRTYTLINGRKERRGRERDDALKSHPVPAHSPPAGAGLTPCAARKNTYIYRNIHARREICVYKDQFRYVHLNSSKQVKNFNLLFARLFASLRSCYRKLRQTRLKAACELAAVIIFSPAPSLSLSFSPSRALVRRCDWRQRRARRDL